MKTAICLAAALLLCSIVYVYVRFLPERVQVDAGGDTQPGAVAGPIVAQSSALPVEDAIPKDADEAKGAQRTQQIPVGIDGANMLAQQLLTKINHMTARDTINLRPDSVVDIVNQHLGLSIPKSETVLGRLEAAQVEFQRTLVQAETDAINELKTPIVEELRSQGRFEKQDMNAKITPPRRPKGSGSVAYAFEGGHDGAPRIAFEIKEEEFPDYFRAMRGLEDELAEAWLPVALEAMLSP